MKAIRTYSPQEFEAVFNDNYPALIFYARKFVGQEAAEELMQEIFVALWKGEIAYKDLFQEVYTRCGPTG